MSAAPGGLRELLIGPDSLRWASALLAVGTAAVVTGASVAWLQGLDEELTPLAGTRRWIR